MCEEADCNIGDHEKYENEFFILNMTCIGNLIFIIILFFLFKKIREWRGDKKTFTDKIIQLKSENTIDGKYAA